MRQTIAQMKAISQYLRKALPSVRLHRMDNVRACADESSTVRFKFVLFCNDDLPDSYQILPRTLIR